MSLLLSENLPLRTSAALGDYAAETILPVVYGDLSGVESPVVKLSETVYLCADHPAQLSAVYLDGGAIHGWAQDTGVDRSGHAWCRLTLAAPPPPGGVITVAMRGKRDPRTGTLIEHPADVLQDVLALAGKTWDCSRLKMELPGMAIAGRLDALQSVRAWADDITRSCGVVWSERRVAAYPAPAGVVSETLDAGNCSVTSAEASVRDAADRLELAFDYHPARGEFAQTMIFGANPSPFPASPIDLPPARVEAPWLRQTADAIALASRLLERLARQRLSVTLQADAAIRPGDWITLDHPELPGGATPMMALSVAWEPGSPAREIGGEIYLSGPPAIQLENHARAIRPKGIGGITSAWRNGVVTFTLLDENKQPLQNARVALDGSAPRTTSAQGKVSFDAPRGAHRIAITASGYAPFEMGVSF